MNKKNIPDYCIFILTYGRPDKQYTLKLLENSGVTKKIYLVVSTDDSTLPEYQSLYGDKVITYQREDYPVMLLDNLWDDRKGIVVFARNAVYDLAEKLGYEFFLVLDDDLFFVEAIGQDKKGKRIRNLQKVFDILFEFYREQERVKFVSIFQYGDFLGGVSSLVDSMKRIRKAMNVFFCSTKRRVQFVGRMLEDMCMYTRQGNLGDIFLSVPIIVQKQSRTESLKGGFTEVYQRWGTYNKSMRVFLLQPSSVRIGKLRGKEFRLRASVLWNKTVPKIISEKWKHDSVLVKEGEGK